VTIDLEAEIAAARPEPRRDRFGRYLIVPAAGGKARAYTRATTWAGALDDKEGLIKWSMKTAALGFVARKDLFAQLAAARADDRDALYKLCEQAKEAGGGSEGANLGTALHAFTERVDLGEDIVVPDPWKADVAAYRQALEDARLTVEPGFVERVVVLEQIGVAGTLDRVYRTADGRLVIGDVKGLALDTQLPTPTGWTTIGAVQVGDQVIGSDGRPCNVVNKSALRERPCYRLRFDDGTTVVADDEHRWAVRTGEARPFTDQILTTAELAASIFGSRGQRQHRVLNATPLALPDVDLPIDPYVLGLWLGDGKHTSGEITKPITNGIWAEVQQRGFSLGKPYVDKRTGCATITVLGLRTLLRQSGILGHKHVPNVYLRASERQRLDLLRGLMDSDGSWNKPRRRAQFTSVDKPLAQAVYELVVSLGDRAHLAEVTRKGFGCTVTAFDVTWAPSQHNPFAEPGKAARVRLRDTGRNRHRLIVAVDEIVSVPTQCIAVDSNDHTYLCTEAMVPTHNTGQNLDYSALAISVQLALYANADTLYDLAAETHEPMVDVDRSTALVLHVPAGQGRAEVLEVDIAWGWERAQLAGAVRESRTVAKRKGVVMKPYRPDRSTDVTPEPESEPEPAQRPTAVGLTAPGDSTPTQAEPTPRTEIFVCARPSSSSRIITVAPAEPTPEVTPGYRAYVARRLDAVKADNPAAALLRDRWPAGVPSMKGAHVHTDDELKRVVAALEAAERDAAAPPAEPDEGPRISDAEVAAITDQIEALTAEQRAVLNGWAREANEAGKAFNLRMVPSVRRHAIYRACLELAELIEPLSNTSDDDAERQEGLAQDLDLCRATVAAVIPTAAFPTVPIGHALGSLTVAEAEQLAAVAVAARNGEAALTYDLEGGVRWAWPNSDTDNPQEDDY